MACHKACAVRSYANVNRRDDDTAMMERDYCKHVVTASTGSTSSVLLAALQVRYFDNRLCRNGIP
jgi:hypothetical protein